MGRVAVWEAVAAALIRSMDQIGRWEMLGLWLLGRKIHAVGRPAVGVLLHGEVHLLLVIWRCGHRVGRLLGLHLGGPLEGLGECDGRMQLWLILHHRRGLLMLGQSHALHRHAAVDVGRMRLAVHVPA